MKILDVCCGSKMFWYNKEEPHTTFMDIRDEVLTYTDRNVVRKVEVNPDLVADFSDLNNYYWINKRFADWGDNSNNGNFNKSKIDRTNGKA